MSGFDVIVVGGGPAGSMTGYHLAKAGLKVAVLEAKRFPREKACGGGLQARAAQQIPFDLTPVLRGAMSEVSLSFGLGRPHTRGYPEPLVYGVLRPEFDAYLLERAAAAGASVRQGVRSRGFSIDGHVTAHTECGDYSARLLVGADGANSSVSRLLNRREDYFWQAALYSEIPRESFLDGALRDESMRIDWGSLPSGYAWIFPKRGYVNVGAGAPARVARLLRPYLARFVRALGVLKPGVAERLNFSGHPLPTLTRSTRLASSRVVLVGDAAGLVEPFTGDGISFACHSARTAADCIVDRPADPSAYDTRLRAELGDEFLWARKVLALAAAFPGAIFRLFQHSDRVWSTFCRILRGEESFERLKREIVGPLGFAWGAIDLLTQWRERRALDAAATR